MTHNVHDSKNVSELYRPQYHFTPPANWMNDPNGLVYLNGEYHLFYQYHPASIGWGPMHWGHALSRDLVNWQHLPIALYPDEQGMIFSGSAVVDWKNTAGFGRETLVAIFTYHRDRFETQNLAYSADQGRTWTKYADNPVIPNPGLPDFRDPKVFWHEDHWVMTLAAGRATRFYVSADLKHWEPSGSFGEGYGCTEGVWETPDLFPLKVDRRGGMHWVLMVGVSNGAPAGGSGTQYFVGAFDGKTFTTENPKDTVLWADFGADYYAAQSWNDEPSGRRLMLGWQNNWDYARVIPTSRWRGAFSLPRELSLTQTAKGIRLVQQPVSELQTLRGAHQHWQGEKITPGSNLLADVHGDALEIVAEFQENPSADCFGFRVHVGADEFTTIGFNAQQNKLFIDRIHSGRSDFYAGFAATQVADLMPINGLLRLHIFVDRASVEVFANDGQVVFSDSIFPSEQSQGLELFTEGGPVRLNSLDVYQINAARFSISNDLENTP